MIVKKPYAFLIKHFKLLHLIVATLMIYLSIRINLITNLFNKLANNVSVSLNGLSDKYINLFMYLVIIIIVFISFAIWYLMKNKEKPTKFYIFIIVYYSILFLFLLVFSSAISTIEEVSVTNQSLRVYKDISFLLPLFQYYFIIMAILRGIGFNIKQFNFSKDIKELEISEEDSEEIEVNLSNNVYKYSRFGRKRLRELKYYFFENKYWILIILGLAVIIGIIIFFVNYKFVNNNYTQGTTVMANSYNVFVNNVYVSKSDLYGEIIKKGKKYVIVNINIRNRYYESRELILKNFILEIGDDYYYPITNKNSSFNDLGLPYDYKYLDLENDYNYILIYEVDDDVSTSNMNLKIYNKINYETDKVDFININLKPININNIQEKKIISINEKVNFNKDRFGNTELSILNYKFINNYEYNYELCTANKCSSKLNVLLPDDILNNKLIMIDYELLLDKSSNLYTFVTNDKKFFNTFVILSYNLEGKEEKMKFNALTIHGENNIIFMEVPKELEDSDNINIIINTRDNKYIYKIK